MFFLVEKIAQIARESPTWLFPSFFSQVSSQQNLAQIAAECPNLHLYQGKISRLDFFLFYLLRKSIFNFKILETWNGPKLWNHSPSSPQFIFLFWLPNLHVMQTTWVEHNGHDLILTVVQRSRKVLDLRVTWKWVSGYLLCIAAFGLWCIKLRGSQNDWNPFGM